MVQIKGLKYKMESEMPSFQLIHGAKKGVCAFQQKQLLSTCHNNNNLLRKFCEEWVMTFLLNVCIDY
jgi:hypothetical protein